MVLLVTVIVFGFTVPRMLSKGGNVEFLQKVDTVPAYTLVTGDIIMDGNGSLASILNVSDCDDFITVETETDEQDFDPDDMVDLYSY